MSKQDTLEKSYIDMQDGFLQPPVTKIMITIILIMYTDYINLCMCASATGLCGPIGNRFGAPLRCASLLLLIGLMGSFMDMQAEQEYECATH